MEKQVGAKMTKSHRNLVNHSFHGRRFDDGGVDLDVTPDLLRFKTLLVEVAKELWRRNNPDRKNLPKNFEDSLSMKFYEVRDNCATIPLERVLTADDCEQLWDDDELDDAVNLVAETIEAAGNDLPLPEQFPKHLLVLFQEYGKTLRDEEWIEQRPAKRESVVRYDAAVREQLTRWVETPYEDAVDLTGEVTMARVSNPLMTIQLNDGRKIEAAFRLEDEDIITSALKQHTTAKLRVVGRGQFGADGQVRKVTQVTEVSLFSSGERPFDSSAKPIWDVFAEILADTPDEQFAMLPVDGADRHDFYIHGSREVNR